jgi:solute carrier family 6 amino acid transporter-like protein 5/7/9/14
VVGLFVGLVFVTPGGQWILVLVDSAAVSLGFINTVLHISFIMWIYGLEKFCWDAEFMLKWKATYFWRFSWGIVTPGLLVAIFVYSMTEFQVPTYLNLSYPTEAYIAWWFVYLLGSLQILLWGVYLILRDEISLKKLKNLFKVNPVWGPKSPEVFKDWKEYKKEKKEKRKIQSEKHSRGKKILWILLGKYY